MKLGLDRLELALEAIGSPHVGLRAVHIAGSNGKGSTSAMVESIARAAGLRTGLYTSPHLSRFAERIRLGGEPIDDVSFERSLGAILDHCPPDLTFFRNPHRGGLPRLPRGPRPARRHRGRPRRPARRHQRDPAPLATAVTSISLEHTAILGDTIDLIAREKAGIFKPSAPVVLGPLAPEADRAVTEVAERVGTGPITRVQRDGAWTPGVIRARWEDGVTDLHGPTDADRFHGPPRCAAATRPRTPASPWASPAASPRITCSSIPSARRSRASPPRAGRVATSASCSTAPASR